MALRKRCLGPSFNHPLPTGTPLTPANAPAVRHFTNQAQLVSTSTYVDTCMSRAAGRLTCHLSSQY